MKIKKQRVKHIHSYPYYFAWVDWVKWRPFLCSLEIISRDITTCQELLLSTDKTDLTNNLIKKKVQTIWSSNPTPGHLSRENHNSKWYMHPNVHSSTIYNNQDMKQTQCPSTQEWIKKMWYIYIHIHTHAHRVIVIHKHTHTHTHWNIIQP